MSENPPDLTDDELRSLASRVFAPRREDRGTAILVDLPDAAQPDTPHWRDRRALAADWAHRLGAHLVLYRNVRTNNADLPASAWRHPVGLPPAHADELLPEAAEPLVEILAEHSMLIALTELSATAPLKLLARRHGFRAATMPGFNRSMVPALRLDYGEVNRRVDRLKSLLDAAEVARLEFVAEEETFRLDIDLRHREAHASGGLVRESGCAGNLPSGEAYVVPYEGELPGEPSRSQGILPVQLGDEVVRYRIVENRAVEVLSQGEESRRESQRLAEEPAYGNLAELGLGVLAAFGVEPVGEILLDEKLGLHIAFGRSDHFGGQVGASAFRRADRVVHIDRVYLPALQPRVEVPALRLGFPDGSDMMLLRNGQYIIDF